MGDFLGLLLRIIADIYAMILALHLVLEERMFFLNPICITMRQAAEPLLVPLRRALGSQVRAVWTALVLVLVARGMALGFLSPGQLVFSPASVFLGRGIGVVPVL